MTDESQDISDIIYNKSIAPMGASTYATTVHLGTSNGEKSWFYDLIQMNTLDDVNKKLRRRCHSQFDCDVVQKYNKRYRKYLDKERKRLGEDSDAFQMAYKLKWLLGRGMFMEPSFFLSLGDVGKTVATYDVENLHVAGIDYAKAWDSTVVTIMEVDYAAPVLIDSASGTFRFQKRVKNWLELHGDNWDEQYYQIIEFLSNYKIKLICDDATGVGSPMHDRIANYMEGKGVEVVPVIFSAEVNHELYLHLHNELLASPARVSFPASERTKSMRKFQNFMTQLTNLQKQYVGGMLRVTALYEKGHTDYADSLALACWAAERADVGMNEAEEVRMNIYHRDEPYQIGQSIGNKPFWKN